MFKCKLCKNKFKIISSTHLYSAHSCTLKEYTNKYGSEGVGFLVNFTNIRETGPRYKRWRKSLFKRGSVWNKGHTKETHLGLAKISETFKRKKINNFEQWRKKVAEEGSHKFGREYYLDLQKGKPLAFLVGLILGDGHISKMARTEGLRVTLGTDKPQLWKFSAQLLKEVFNKEPHIAKRKSANCVDLVIYEKYLSERLSIPAGSRGNLDIKLPLWIWGNNGFLIACIRGLFEAEGSFSVHKPTYTYNLAFSNKNRSLLDEM